MLTRIQKIMDEKQLSISAFADEIGVKRPTMTHTMTGRNNPSLDIISKILERYNEINADWLLFGKGSMYKNYTPTQAGLFDQLENVKSNSEEDSILKNEQEHSLKIPPVIFEEEKYSKKTNANEKKISKILIFFSDNTFETFIPEDKQKNKTT